MRKVQVINYIKIILLLLIFAIGIRAQPPGQNVIYQPLALNDHTSLPKNWGPVTNIGQGFHQVQLIIFPLGGGACGFGDGVSSPTINIIGSYTNPLTQAFLIPSKTTAAFTSVNTFTYTVQGVGTFPFITININHIDLSNCQYNLFYSGSLFPITPIDANLGPPSLTNNLTQVVTTTFPSIFGGGTFLTANLYSLDFTNDTTVPQTLTIKCGITAIYTFPNLASGQQIHWGYQGIPYLHCYASSLSFNVTGGSPTVLYTWKPE